MSNTLNARAGTSEATISPLAGKPAPKEMLIDVARLEKENPNVAVPVDLVTTSASGLDPDISPAAA